MVGLTQKKITKLKAGRHHDRHGLYLELSGKKGSGSWLLRYQTGGKEHWHGLGSKRLYTLEQARDRAIEAQKKLDNGEDPIKAKREARTKAKLAAAKSTTFEKAAQSYFDAYRSKWSIKHREQFIGTLQKYAFPKLGELPVADIDTGLVLSVLQPIWIDRHVTAARLRGRIEVVLDWCVPHGFRPPSLNPAAWNGNLKAALPDKVKKVVHHRALAYDQVPAFVQQLSAHQGTGPRLLEFIILSAARTGEAVHARWSEIDLEQKIWSIPANRMKSGRPHRVPLTARMIALLKALPREGGPDGGLVFLGLKANRPLDKMVMPKLIASMGFDTTIHGFRSAFRDWAGDRTAFQREVAEAALAHAIGDSAEQAYRRNDALEKRRLLMDVWSNFVSTPSSGKSGDNVTPIRKDVV